MSFIQRCPLFGGSTVFVYSKVKYCHAIDKTYLFTRFENITEKKKKTVFVCISTEVGLLVLVQYVLKLAEL